MQESEIRWQLHCFLHRLITKTINPRQEGEKVPTLDAFFYGPSSYWRSVLTFHILWQNFWQFGQARIDVDHLFIVGCWSLVWHGPLESLKNMKPLSWQSSRANLFSPLLYKRVCIIIENGYGNFSIPNDTPRNQPGRQVRQRSGDAGDDKPP